MKRYFRGLVAALALPLTLALALTLPGAAGAQVANLGMFGADTAFILPKGAVYAAGSLMDPRGGIPGNDRDGIVSFGAGFGDPVTALGLQADLNVTGTDPFGDGGNMTFKVARMVYHAPAHVVFASAAVGNVLPWGDEKGRDTRWNMTVSGLTSFQGPTLLHPVMWTAGYGSHAVLSTPGSSLTEEGFYGGVGTGITTWLGAGVGFTENQLNAGISLKIPGLEHVGITYGINDITDHMDRRQQVLSISISKSKLFGWN